MPFDTTISQQSAASLIAKSLAKQRANERNHRLRQPTSRSTSTLCRPHAGLFGRLGNEHEPC